MGDTAHSFLRAWQTESNASEFGLTVDYRVDFSWDKVKLSTTLNTHTHTHTHTHKIETQ